MMTMLLLRLAKLLAVLMLVSGSVGAVMPGPLASRRRFAFWLAGPGFGLTWSFGVLLTWTRHISLLSSWILLSFALSFLSLQGVLYAVGKDGRLGVGSRTLTLLPLLLTLALMVFRPR